jgi:hypothetical protein
MEMNQPKALNKQIAAETSKQRNEDDIRDLCFAHTDEV